MRMRLSTPRSATSSAWIHAVLSLGRRAICTCSQPGGPSCLTRNASGTFSTVGFGSAPLASVAPGASYNFTSDTTASAAWKGCAGLGTVVVVVDVVVVVVGG